MPTTWLGTYGPLISVIVAIFVVAVIRLRLASVPIERDEGEYAYAGQLILRGIPTYTLAYNMKFPGTYYTYGILMAVFGQTAWGIHVGLLIINAATTLMVFFLGKRLIGGRPAAVASITFVLLSLDRAVLGPFAHATHFVTLPALAGLLLLLAARFKPGMWRLLLSGALLGAAVLMKQQAIALLPFAMAFLWWHNRSADHNLRTSSIRRLGLLAAGMAAPFALMCAVFTLQGNLGRFWFWTIHYAWAYVSEVSLSQAWPALASGWDQVTPHTFAFWLLGFAGGILLWLGRWPVETRVFLTGLLVATFLCVCPSFNFRPHYFIVMLPAIALLVGVMIAAVERGLRWVVGRTGAAVFALGVFAGVTGTYAYDERAFLFSMSPPELSLSIYGLNPFVEAPAIAEYVKAHTAPADRIAVLGSEPEMLFYAKRTSATGYIYMYPLMEAQSYATRMQEEMRREIEQVHPTYLIEVPMNASWQIRPDSNRGILTWMDQYIDKCYDLVGLTEIKRGSNEPSVILWDAQIEGYAPRSKNVILTLRQKTSGPCTVEH